MREMFNVNMKFRAWDKINKKWIGTGTDGWLLAGNGYIILLGFEACCVDYSPPTFKLFSDGKQETLSVVQNTGRKDKNGTQIWEDDIMHFGEEEGLWSDQVNRYVKVQIPFICGNAHLGEVVGNMYEESDIMRRFNDSNTGVAK